MNKLRLSRRNKLAFILVLWPAWLHAVYSKGGNYELTKTLIGASGSETLGAEKVAAWADTICWEILCGIGPRVPRVYVGSNDA